MLAYAVYQLGAFLAQRFRLPTARRGAAVVGRLSCAFQRRNRRHLYRNLQIAFGERLSRRELRRLRLRIYENFGVFVADFLRFPEFRIENADEWMHAGSEERFLEFRRRAERGEPTIFFTAHLGNWELGAATAAMFGCPMTVLADEHPSRHVTGFFDARRESKGLAVVPVASFHRCFRALRKGNLVAIVGDRAVTGHGITRPFFGRPAIVPAGHALLARRLGATIVPAFFVMREDDRYELLVEEPIVPRVTDDEGADVRDCVDRCLRVAERYIRRYPEQWYVFRPMWPRRGSPELARSYDAAPEPEGPMRTLVAIPSKNLERTIGNVVREVLALDLDLDVLVVNDGSTDGTSRAAREAGATVVEHPVNRGKGAALRTAFAYALEHGYGAVITMDGDEQHDPGTIPRFVAALEKGSADLVVGTRMHAVGDMPAIRRWTNRTTSRIVSRLAGQEIPDSQSGYRIHRSELLREIAGRLVTSKYDTESEILIRAGRKGYTIAALPIESIYTDSVSHINPVVDTLRFIGLAVRSIFWR